MVRPGRNTIMMRTTIRAALAAACLAPAAHGAAESQVIRDHLAVGYPLLNEFAYDITRAADGGYLTAGYTDPETDQFGDIYVVRYDGLGKHQWSRIIESSSHDREVGYSVRQTGD